MLSRLASLKRIRRAFLFRLLVSLLIGIAAGPRPALAAGGEVICGLGLIASYDFEKGAPRPVNPGLVGCDNCLAAAPVMASAFFFLPGIERRPLPALRKVQAASPAFRIILTAHPRAPPV